MQIEPNLGEETGRGKSRFAVNRGAVNRGFTVLSLAQVMTWSRSCYKLEVEYELGSSDAAMAVELFDDPVKESKNLSKVQRKYTLIHKCILIRIIKG